MRVFKVWGGGEGVSLLVCLKRGCQFRSPSIFHPPPLFVLYHFVYYHRETNKLRQLRGVTVRRRTESFVFLSPWELGIMFYGGFVTHTKQSKHMTQLLLFSFHFSSFFVAPKKRKRISAAVAYEIRSLFPIFVLEAYAGVQRNSRLSRLFSVLRDCDRRSRFCLPSSKRVE